MHLSELILTKKSSLIGKFWNPSKRRYVSRPISANRLTAHWRHDINCTLENGVTLQHIFKFIMKDVDTWDFLLGNWCKLIVQEGLSPISKDIKKRFIDRGTDDFTTDYLELYSYIELDNDRKLGCTINSSRILDFHGIGKYLEDGDYWKKGDTTAIGISLTPANALRHLLVKVKPTLDIYEEVYTWNGKTISDVKRNILKADVKYNVSLFDILYSIIWELTWHGPPVKRAMRSKQLLSRIGKLNKTGTKNKK